MADGISQPHYLVYNYKFFMLFHNHTYKYLKYILYRGHRKPSQVRQYLK